MARNKQQRQTQPEIVQLPDPAAVKNRLQELRVPLEILQKAIRNGQAARDFANTKAHPRTYPGSAEWGETNAALREGLALQAWSLNDDDNIPRIISPDGSVVITAVSGNENTGWRDKEHPATTRNPRREAGIRIVRRNNQLILHELLSPDIGREAVEGGIDVGPTWFLLYYRNKDAVRSELSLAVKVSDSGVLMDWSERLILPEIDLLDGGTSSRDELPSTHDVDVPVERRAG